MRNILIVYYYDKSLENYLTEDNSILTEDFLKYDSKEFEFENKKYKATYITNTVPRLTNKIVEYLSAPTNFNEGEEYLILLHNNSNSKKIFIKDEEILKIKTAVKVWGNSNKIKIQTFSGGDGEIYIKFIDSSNGLVFKKDDDISENLHDIWEYYTFDHEKFSTNFLSKLSQ